MTGGDSKEEDLELGLTADALPAQMQFERENMFRSCCFFIDSRCIKFGAQVFFSCALLAFSMYKLAVVTEETEKSPYYVILSSTVAAWMPNPKLPTEKKI